MTAPQPSERLDSRITRSYGTLPPQERRAADTLLEHLDDLATYRAAELAALAGVSKATMSRLFRTLGFADFDEVRDHLRSLRTSGEPQRIDGPPDIASLAAAETASIEAALQQPALADAVELLAGARQVLVVGWRNSYPVALHLREQLIQARPTVAVGPVPGQMIGEEVTDLGPDDVVVAIGFRRRPKLFGSFIDAVLETDARLVVLADPTGRVHLARAHVGLECPVEGRLAFDSYAAAMSLVAALADGVLGERGREGSQRVAAISRAYGDLGEVE
ncbi:MurR/RpiR family transcriptional regulator [Nocardioides cavernaquae]|uniref:MurR/RpiR family transcriptional regulator n=1 Tax=Nocardioides cavernaquae TaxID=2321396 RepID=A0A3A5H811_9ACTN|nr:MurR/RpiR family transcriptional regulator [Nocardioides cavernaquae]RJS46582.1 MurR/RpiR family transcriptional regulator [Nocardioides cavernaquae]